MPRFATRRIGTCALRAHCVVAARASPGRRQAVSHDRGGLKRRATASPVHRPRQARNLTHVEIGIAPIPVRRNGRLERPSNGQTRIVPSDATLRARRVELGRLIRNLSLIVERFEAVGESFGDVEHPPVGGSIMKAPRGTVSINLITRSPNPRPPQSLVSNAGIAIPLAGFGGPQALRPASRMNLRQ